MSRDLGLVSDELELTLIEEEVLRTTVVVARMELSELFCIDVVGFFSRTAGIRIKGGKTYA